MAENKRYGVTESADFLLGLESALILCHTNPDGDTLGSALALRAMLRSLGCDAEISVPSAIPESLAFLTEGVGTSFDPGRFGALIAVDVAAAEQLGENARLAGKVSFMIDHHRNGSPFAPGIIDPDASAAGEIVYSIREELLLRGALKGSPDEARYVFAAISSDTGSFKFSNTTPRTFEIAASLAEEISAAKDGGLACCDISRFLHDTLTETVMRVNCAVANKIELYEGGSLAFCRISAEDIKELRADESDFGCAIDTVRSLKGVDVAVTLRQKPDGSKVYKVSARSGVDLDVSSVLAKFGGGGHIRAAGATLYGMTFDEACRRVLEAFRAAVSEYREMNK